MLDLEKKLKVFEVICGDWDYRNIDMTEPHLQKIDIVQNNLLISCELFSPVIDDYVFCNGGIINDKDLVRNFKKLNFNNKELVLDFISSIESKINWDKVNHDLYNQVDLEKEKFKIEEKSEEYEEPNDYNEEDVIIEPAEKLGEGWNWYKYTDGSGHLKSPNGKEYMSYDLDTDEYKVTRDCRYDLFPLNYYYIDGVSPSEFDPFEYMENEMLERILPREKEKEESNIKHSVSNHFLTDINNNYQFELNNDSKIEM